MSDSRLFNTIPEAKLAELHAAMLRAEKALPTIVTVDGHSRFKAALEQRGTSECRLIPGEDETETV